MEQLMDFGVKALIIQTLIIAFCTLGWVQWIKNFISFSDKNKKYYAVISLVVTVVCVIMNSKIIPAWLTFFWNSIAVCNAFVQLAYEAIIEGAQNMIKRFMVNAVDTQKKEV